MGSYRLPVPGCSGGFIGVGRSAIILYHCLGISWSSKSTLTCFIVILLFFKVYLYQKKCHGLSSHGIYIFIYGVMGRIFPAHAHFFVRAYGQTFKACHHQLLLKFIINMTFQPNSLTDFTFFLASKLILVKLKFSKQKILYPGDTSNQE